MEFNNVVKFSQHLLPDTIKLVEPHGHSPWHLIHTPVGRHPGPTLATTARGRGFLCRGLKEGDRQAKLSKLLDLDLCRRDFGNLVVYRLESF